MAKFIRYLAFVSMVSVIPNFTLGQSYYINCYSEGENNWAYHYVFTKSVDLESKSIVFETLLATQGEILNIKPIPLNIFDNNILLTAINHGCYCKNTAPDTVRTSIVSVDAIKGYLIIQFLNYTYNIQRLINYTFYDFASSDTERFYISASGASNNYPDMRGIY